CTCWITIDALAIELDVAIADVGVAQRRPSVGDRRRRGRAGLATGRSQNRDAREQHQHPANDVVRAAWAPRLGVWHCHFGAARYGNAVENVLCGPTLSVQSGNVPGLHTNCVASSRSLKIAESPVSTTSSVSLRPP